jgi:hypothetical protein
MRAGTSELTHFNLGFSQHVSASPATSSCSFQDGKQISVRYDSEAIDGNKDLHTGRVWMPVGQLRWRFTQTEVCPSHELLIAVRFAAARRKKIQLVVCSRDKAINARTDEYRHPHGGVSMWHSPS